MQKPNASKIRRLAAYFIDWYLSSLCINMVISIFASVYNHVLTIDSTITKLPVLYQIPALLAGFALSVVYFILPQWINPSFCGQSPGKLILRIRVIRIDGKKAGLSTLLLRYGVGFVLVEETLYSASYFLRSVLSQFIGSSIVEYAYVVSCVITIISIIMLFKDRSGQMIHDKIAGTIVVGR